MNYLGLIPVLLLIAIVPAFATESVLTQEFGSIPEDVEQQIEIDINGTWYLFNYFTTNVFINSAEADLDFISLVFDVNVPKDGVLSITIPRDAFDSKFQGVDDDFIILANGDEPESNEIETTSTYRTLEIHLPTDTTEIEIIGSIFEQIPPPEPPSNSLQEKYDKLLKEHKELQHKYNYLKYIFDEIKRLVSQF